MTKKKQPNPFVTAIGIISAAYILGATPGGQEILKEVTALLKAYRIAEEKKNEVQEAGPESVSSP